MATQTTNLKLVRIDLNDAPPDITVLNQNWDKLDAKFNADGTISTSALDIPSVATALKQSGGVGGGDSSEISYDNANTTLEADTVQEAITELSERKGAAVYTATIGTNWTENADTGVKTQDVAIAGILASHNAKVDTLFNGADSLEDYGVYVAAQNQYLDFITNGHGKTYDGFIRFTIYGDANTVNIPIIVEVV